MRWCKCLSCSNVEVEDVTTLDFSCSSLTEVPSIVFNFERTLQILHLDSNKIIELPRTLFQCEELKFLGLCDNEIETIPPLIEKLINLENLLLNRNCLSYESISPNIHRCQRLKVLHLSSNNLTKVPGSITRLVSLKELYLNNCDLEFLPANFGRLNNLRILELRENHLTTLPKSLKRLSDLRRLDISSNMFKKFPEVIGTMTNLTELWVNDNFISDIPDSIGNLHKLTHFDVSCNRLEKITNTIGLCTSITLLLLSMNDLQELPPTVGNLNLLHTLKVDHNLLHSLPQNIGKLSNLEELDVQFNNLQSFPNSIGMLRKLNSLVAAQNLISQLPTEIGSCTALSVLSLHYNELIYLPEEIGHLQNLTSISLISNRLRYLPITILSLQKLKALWLSYNQSQPLITLQTDTLTNGQVVLTCVFLPQVEVPLQVDDSPQLVVSTGKRIGFTEPTFSNDLPAKLNRIPTPHPKAFVKYQRTLENTLRRSQENVTQNLSVDPVYVKEANIVPMKYTVDETDSMADGSLQRNDTTTKYKASSLHNSNGEVQEDAIFQRGSVQNPGFSIQNNNENSETRSDCISSDYESTALNTNIGIACSDLYTCNNQNKIDNNQKEICSTNKQSQTIIASNTKPKQPPPYHIAAIYSRRAQYFINSADKSTIESEPKHFTQDQPLNILNPQPKHPYDDTQPQQKNLFEYCTDTEIQFQNYENDMDVYKKICTITSHLLRVDLENQQYKSLIKQYLQLYNDEDIRDGNFDIIEIKLKILKTAEYLLCCNLSKLHEDFLQHTLNCLYGNLETILNVVVEQSLFTKQLSTEVREKLTVIDITTILLSGNNNREEYYDLLHYIINVEKILPVNKSHENCMLTNLKFGIDTVTQSKLQLIKIVIYFLSIANSVKEYKYIFGKFIQLQRRLPYFLKIQSKHLHIENTDKNERKIEFAKANIENENKPTKNKQKGNINWLFGVHRNPKIIKVELTPCCYVLGFTVTRTDEGVFIERVDENGNAFKKLFPGDKILMLDDRDITKMDSEDALKAVQVWGPETETFLISRY